MPEKLPGGVPPPDPCCPLCGGALTQAKCKVLCTRCHAVVSNCNGD